MGVNFKALAQIPGMYRAGQEAGYRREQRETARKDRAYQDRLKEASGKIVSMPGITGDQVLALAAEYELNPMDIYKVLSAFKAVQHQNAQMDEFSKSAAYNEQVRAHNVGQNQRTVEKQGLADNLMADIATREQGLGGMGGLQPAGMPMNPAEEGRDAGITQRSDRDIADRLVQRGVGADMEFHFDDPAAAGAEDALVGANTYLAEVWRVGADYGITVINDTGTGAARSIAHGGGAIPTGVWAKNLTDATGTIVYCALSASDPETDYADTSDTDAFADLNTMWGDTAPNATNIRVGTNNETNGDGDNMLYICFFDIPQLRRVFACTGNANADGPMVPLDFLAENEIQKAVTAATMWAFLSSTLDDGNPADDILQVQDPGALSVDSTNDIDILSNGFKIRNSNAGMNAAALHIGWAVAKQPGKYANAR